MTAPKLKIEYRKPSDLSAYEKNARTHPPEQIEALAKAIEEFGFTNPVLISEDNVIRAGHARVEAAKRLGMQKLPVIVLSHLSEAQQRAIIISDNQIASLSDWSTRLLSEELKELQAEDFDINLLGFDNKELEDLLSLEDEPAPEGGGSADEAAAGEAEDKEVLHMRRITVTPEQYSIIEQTVIKFRQIEQDASISFGRALELISGDWLSGQ